jgi:hypothetical protein
MHWLIEALVSPVPLSAAMQPFYTTCGQPYPLSCPLRREISPLRFASVEMTRGALANIVISSGGMRRYGC